MSPKPRNGSNSSKNSGTRRPSARPCPTFLWIEENEKSHRNMLVGAFARHGPSSKQPEHGLDPNSTGRPAQPGDAGPDHRLPGATRPAAVAGHGYLLFASPAD